MASRGTRASIRHSLERLVLCQRDAGAESLNKAPDKDPKAAATRRFGEESSKIATLYSCVRHQENGLYLFKKRDILVSQGFFHLHKRHQVAARTPSFEECDTGPDAGIACLGCSRILIRPQSLHSCPAPLSQSAKFSIWKKCYLAFSAFVQRQARACTGQIGKNSGILRIQIDVISYKSGIEICSKAWTEEMHL